MPADKYVSVKEIQETLSCSRSRAYEIAAECRRVLIGKRGVRIVESAFRQWLERRTIAGKSTDLPASLRRWPSSRYSVEDDGVPLRLVFPRTKPKKTTR